MGTQRAGLIPADVGAVEVESVWRDVHIVGPWEREVCVCVCVCVCAMHQWLN